MASSKSLRGLCTWRSWSSHGGPILSAVSRHETKDYRLSALQVISPSLGRCWLQVVYNRHRSKRAAIHIVEASRRFPCLS